MTLVLAYAGPRLAFVAADRRGERRHWRDGDFGPAVQQSLVRKMAPLGGSWVVLAGWPIADRALVPLLVAPPGPRRARALRTLRERVPRPADLPESVFVERARVWTIAPSGEGFGLEQTNWWTGAVDDLTGRVLCVVPGDWPTGADDALYRRVGQRLLPALGRSGRAAVVEVVRGVGELFAHVYATLGAEGSVSEDLEVAVLSRERGRVWSEHLGPTRPTTIPTLTDAALDTALRPMTFGTLVGRVARDVRGWWAGAVR